ncbi:MAG: glycosyltransferase [Paludibacter sp.]|nr:glycosyltransferase [Paludibacter sp.]
MLSVITPVLNGAEFIEKNIKSIQQLKVPYEHIIVDGGSTDDTLDIIGKYPHLKLIRQTEKNGMYGAIDLGFKQSKGDYICWVNCDDEIYPKNFGEMYFFAINGELDFVNSDSLLLFVNEHKEQKIKGTKYAKIFLKRGILPFVQPSSLYKKSLYISVGGLNTNYRIAGDMDLFFRMAIHKCAKFSYFPFVTTVFLKHGDSLGDKNGEIYFSELCKAGIPKPNSFIKILYVLNNKLRIITQNQNK